MSDRKAVWVKDKAWHPSQKTSVQKRGRLKMTLKVANNDELVGWILSFCGEARVTYPEARGQKVKEEAKKIFQS